LEYAASYGSAYLLRRGLFMPWELAQVMDADMALAGLAALDPIHRLDATCAPIPGARAKISALELSWYMRNQLLRDADWAGMAHSLEIRTPLVDAHLFYAVAGLGADKRMMAAAPATPLPGAVLRRPKSGFFVPVRQWLEGEGTDAPNDERGLRGWARRVYARALAN
jgi:asparagine synthase (glutamine-hydrolysing)